MSVNLKLTGLSRDKADPLGIAAVLAVYCAMIIATRPLDLGDTIFYAAPVVAMTDHPNMATLRQLLDFGHVLWRPLGWLVYDGLRLSIPTFAHIPERIAATRVLIGIDVIAGGAATVLLYLICRRLAFSRSVSVITCAAFVVSNAVVNIAHAGSSYMLALTLLLGSLWLVLQRGEHWAVGSVGAGALMALSATVWFPFVLVAPAVFLAGLLWRPEQETSATRSKRVAAFYFVLSALVTGGAVFGAAAYALHIHSAQALLSWIHDSAHGWRQRSTLLRLPLGLARCCLALGDTGLLWKRFLLRDPFAPVSAFDLFRGSIVDIAFIAIFYGGLCGLVWSLLRHPPNGRALLLLLLTAATPLLLFAVFLFEPSSMERFVPVFPFLFLAIGYQLESTWQNTGARALALVLPFTMAASTTAAYRTTKVQRQWAPAISRLEALRQSAAMGSTLALLTNQDVIYSYAANNPVEDTLSTAFQIWPVLRPANERIYCWQEAFAVKSLAVWSTSHEMWVSQRLLAATPQRDWDWAEGDDPAIRWRSVSEFFKSLRFDSTTGVPDGFARLSTGPENRVLFQTLSQDSCAHRPR